MITTTLRRIEEQGPCREGWKRLLLHLGKMEADDEPLALATIVESNGVEDALWCCRTAPEFADTWRAFAIWCEEELDRIREVGFHSDAKDLIRGGRRLISSDRPWQAALWLAVGTSLAVESVFGPEAAAELRARQTEKFLELVR